MATENNMHAFHIVELHPKKYWFDFYCSRTCIEAAGQDYQADGFEHVTPAESLERTGSDGSDQNCWHCDRPVYRPPDQCPQCTGQGAVMGALGNLDWFRCINCGWEWSVAKQLYVDIDALATPGDFIVSD
jgi:hypothetical protein